MIQHVNIPKSTSHFLHFVLTMCTGGLWGIVWFFAWLKNRKGVQITTVTPDKH